MAFNDLPVIISEPVGHMITKVLIPTMNEVLNQLKIPHKLNKSKGFYEIFKGQTIT